MNGKLLKLIERNTRRNLRRTVLTTLTLAMATFRSAVLRRDDAFPSSPRRRLLLRGSRKMLRRVVGVHWPESFINSLHRGPVAPVTIASLPTRLFIFRFPLRSAAVRLIRITPGGNAGSAATRVCVLATSLDHASGREEVAVDRAHVDVQAIAVIESGSMDHGGEPVGQIFVDHRGLEDPFERPDCHPGTRSRAIAVRVEVDDGLPQPTLAVIQV